MKLGLRLHLLLLLGGLMVLAFVPLYFATSTYVRITLQRQQAAHAESLGRSIAAYVSEARHRRSPEQLLELLEAQLATGDVEAVAVYDAEQRPLARLGDLDMVRTLGELRVGAERIEVVEVTGAFGPALAVFVPSERGSVAAVLRIDPQRTRATPLVHLLGLYMGVLALATLLGAYFALTRLIVRPVDALSRAAQRVVRGARELEIPTHVPRELRELGDSLRTMTRHLLHEEEALRRQVDEVQRATERLQSAQDTVVRSERLASVGRLAAGLAHEIGNPISALLGLQDLLLEGDLEPEEQRDFVRRMKRETSRVHSILRDLLQFARPGVERPDLAAPGDVGAALGDVGAAVDDTLALVRPQKAFQDLQVHSDVAPDLPPVRLGHEQLVQVLLNLLMNAADACAGAGSIELRATLVEGASGGAGGAGERAGERVELSVADTGPGVSPDMQRRLFEPFATTKEVGKGTGLGLAVSRGLIEAAGGYLNLDTSYTGGARFVMGLPVAGTPTTDRRPPP